MRALLFVAVVLLVAQPAAAQWVIRCEGIAGAPALPPEACDRSRPTSTASDFGRLLDQATDWLAGHGFVSARVVRSSTRPVAYLADPGWMDQRGDWGFYDYDRQRLVVTGDYGDDGVVGEGYATAVHEMVHAVQASYPYFPGQRTTWTHDWITEGTAEAVALAFTDRFRVGPGEHGPSPADPLAAGGAIGDFGYRVYSDPLHLPASTGDDSDQHYATSHFWLALGEVLGAADRVSYLPPVLEAVDAAGGGVGGVASALGQIHPHGLYHFFPEAIARFARSPAHYEGAGRSEVTAEFDVPHGVETTVPGLAAHHVTIKVPDVGPAGALLEVHLTDHEALHLALDGERPDPIGGERNVLRQIMLEPGEAVAQVINVSRDAAASTARSYTLTATLTPLASCSFRASLVGRGVAVRAETDNLDAQGPHVAFTSATQSGGQLASISLSMAPFAGGDFDWEAESPMWVEVSFEHPTGALPATRIASGAAGTFPVYVSIGVSESASPTGEHIGANSIDLENPGFTGYKRGPGTLRITEHSADVLRGTIEADVDWLDLSGLEAMAEGSVAEWDAWERGTEADLLTQGETDRVRNLTSATGRFSASFRAPIERDGGFEGLSCLFSLAEQGELTGEAEAAVGQMLEAIEQMGGQGGSGQ